MPPPARAGRGLRAWNSLRRRRLVNPHMINFGTPEPVPNLYRTCEFVSISPVAPTGTVLHDIVHVLPYT